MVQLRLLNTYQNISRIFSIKNLYIVVLPIWFLLSDVNNSCALERLANLDVVGDDVFFEILFPPELEYSYRIKPARDFGSPFNSSFWLKKIKLIPANPIDGCTLPSNSAAINGNVAFVARGECSFLHKTLIAEKAGAKAVIITEGIIHSTFDVSPDDYIEMIADKSDSDASIPAAFLLGRSGSYILNTLKEIHMTYAIINIPVNMTYIPIHKMNQPPWVSW